MPEIAGILVTLTVLVIANTLMLFAVINMLRNVAIILHSSPEDMMKRAAKITAAKDDPYMAAWEGDPINPRKRTNTIRNNS